MRWPRRHENDSSLGELLDGPPAAPPATPQGTSQATAVAGAPDEGSDTLVRPLPDDLSDTPDTPDEEGDFLDDEDYLPQERRGPSRLTVALVAALVLAVGVLGGIWVQKQLGSASGGGRSFTAGQGAAGVGAGTGTGQRRYNAGGAASGAGSAGAAAGGAPGAGADAGGSTGGTGTTATPAVVGTVTSAGKTSLVVTDLGGARHTVTVTSRTTLTTPYGHGALAKGDTVAVVGTDTSGSVAATAVTVS